MAYIRVQNLKINDEGIIISGTASICETIYDKNAKGSCRHEVREKLGKVLYITEDHKEGIFLSPTRGLVSYNVNRDTFSLVKENDSRLSGVYTYSKPEVHKVFGDSFLLLEVMKKTHLTEVLHEVFPKEEEFVSVIIHVLYTILRDRSSISFDDFISKSFLSYIVENPDSILDEEVLFQKLGGWEKWEDEKASERTKDYFFEKLLKKMRQYNPFFGESCYAQTVTLHSIDILNPYQNMPYAQKEHIYISKKMLMAVDQDTGIPVWYEIVFWKDPWNAYSLIDGNASIHKFSIHTYNLDATYVIPQLFQEISNKDNKSSSEGNVGHIVWVPEKEPIQFSEIRKKSPSELGEYPYKQVFNKLHNKIGKYFKFSRYSHDICSFKTQLDIFVKDLDSPLFIYVFSDYSNIKWFHTWSVQKKNLAKAKREAGMWEIGGIVLLSDKSCEPSEIFDEYFRWRKSEEALRQYLGLDKPEANYKASTELETDVERGKIFLACMCLIIRQLLADRIKKNRELILTHINYDSSQYDNNGNGLSKLEEEQIYDEVIHRVFGKLQSLMCFERNGKIIIETPSDEVNHIFSDLGINLSASINLKDYIGSILDR